MGRVASTASKRCGLRGADMTTPSAGQPPPEQEQEYPGRTAEMDPAPRDEMRGYEGRGLLAGTRGTRPAGRNSRPDHRRRLWQVCDQGTRRSPGLAQCHIQI